MTHSELVYTLKKNPTDILRAINYGKADLTHMALGISGEAGEILDTIKKHVIYNQPLDEQNLIEELGDIEFYLEGLRQILGVSRDYTLQLNIEKLTKRYGTQYSDAAAKERKDKQ